MHGNRIGLAVSTDKGALMPLSASFRAACIGAVAAAMGLLFIVGLAGAPAATADTCANAELREQNNSTALPDCRAYEMVSPPYKDGFPVILERFTDDGLVSYQSLGNFAGNASSSIRHDFHAARSAAGWTSTSLNPSDLIWDGLGALTNTANLQAESSDLRWSLWQMRRRDTPGEKNGFYLRGPDGAFTRVGDSETAVGPQGSPAGESSDFSHIVFRYGDAGNDEATRLREYVGTGNTAPARLVSVDNQGQPTEPFTCLPKVSTDARVIAYTSGCGVGVTRVWARVGGAATVAVSRSECTRDAGDAGGACNGISASTFEGMAADGSRVFFTTSQQLVNDDTDTGNDLYACDIPDGVPAPVGSANACASLTQVSGTDGGAQVGSVPVVSEDGSRAYFVANGAALADNLGVTGAAPVAGQPNLYVWTKDAGHPAGQVRFVAQFDVDDLPGAVGRMQMTPDGRYVVFRTATALVTSGLGADSDGGALDVYRYDAMTHTVARLSTSVTGAGGNGSGSDISIPDKSALSADGSTVIFDTAEALSVVDTNGDTDVYAWRDGQVSLISAGAGGSADAAGITVSGRDIFFTTDTPILAADGDAVRDIYTARVGGGIDMPQPPAACSGDGCQGLPSGAPGLAGPRSGLVGGDSEPDAATTVFSVRAVSAAQRRRLAAKGKLSLTVAANTAGRVTATARVRIGGRSVAVATGRQTMTEPGSIAVTLKLSRKARKQLAARGKLTVKVSVSHSKATRGRSVTVKLTRARAKKSSVGGRS